MTELLWNGKYRDGRRVFPDRTPRVLLTDEIADPVHRAPRPERGEDDWRNRLVSGDTRDVLPALLPEFARRVNLVYMDPPFATGADHTVAIPLPLESGANHPSPRSLARVAYRDTWGPARDDYLQWFFETVTLLRDLLAEDGAIVVHCDWRADAPLRLILDEVFGAANFRNTIAWAYRSGGASRRESLARKHDTLLLYARSPRFAIRQQVERQYLGKPFIGSRRDAAGRHYVDTLLRDVLDGELTLVRDGQPVRRNLRPVLNVSRERLGYPTQKPLGLLELLIELASDPGDLVLDCCCGSGTTPAASARTGRRWIAADSSPLAFAVTRARLLALPAACPFAVQHVSAGECGADTSLEIFGRALHVTAHSALSPTRPEHEAGSCAAGTDGGGSGQATEGRTCPAPTTDGERSAGLSASLSTASSAVNLSASPSALSSVPSVSTVVNLSASASSANSERSPCSFVTISVNGLTLPERELPAGVVPPGPTSGCDWIAYWMVDWDYTGSDFRIRDWSGRTRGAPPPATLTQAYAQPGRHTIAVRAIDLLGGVTTATLAVDL